jgi:ABC-type Fe3+-hydroxamate transport system substrate-binding protein
VSPAGDRPADPTGPARRVVSLVPSVTETLIGVGVTPVAVTRFCEHPELPAVGGTKNPDIEAIVALAPDLVVLCEEENRKEDADALAAAGMVTLALSVESVDDARFAVDALTAFVGAAPPAPWPPAPGSDSAPASGLTSRDTPARAFVPIWRRPWMSINAATYGSSMLVALGIANVCADDEERFPTVELDEVAARGVDVVLAPSEPYAFREQHVAELEAIAPVELIDGQDLFWWGLRTPAALDRLAARLAAWR